MNLVVLKLRCIDLFCLLLLPFDKERGERFSTARLHRGLRLFHFQVIYTNVTRRFLMTTILQMLSFSRLRWRSAVACLTSLATLTRQGKSKNLIRFVIVGVIIGDRVALHGKTWHWWLNLRSLMCDFASYELLSDLTWHRVGWVWQNVWRWACRQSLTHVRHCLGWWLVHHWKAWLFNRAGFELFWVKRLTF